MLRFLPAPLLGIISVLLYALNLIFWVTLLHMTAIFYYLMPMANLRSKLLHIMQVLPLYYVQGNSVIMRLTTKIEWDISDLKNVDDKHWYLMISNHCSWIDILVLFDVFKQKIPILKFFIKKQLFWVPFLGTACWLLGFPFMKRYSKAFLDKHPELRSRDIETAREACEKFKRAPTTVINFVEGTRFTQDKHERQASPYKNLLRPKAGGVALVLAELKDYLAQIIDVTIIYPQNKISAWQFFSGKVNKITIRIKLIPITQEMIGNYQEDSEFRADFQHWLNQIWMEKDQLLKRSLS